MSSNMDKKKNTFGNVTFAGNVTFNGPMFDIHDNEKVIINSDKPQENENLRSASPLGSSKNLDESKNDEEMFHFIHPAMDEEQERKIHNEVKRLVSKHGVQEICRYLRELESERKVLLPQMASVAYAELVRIGMPQGEGYSEKYFMKHYNL